PACIGVGILGVFGLAAGPDAHRLDANFLLEPFLVRLQHSVGSNGVGRSSRRPVSAKLPADLPGKSARLRIAGRTYCFAWR
ncbi:hypothetical protein ACC686_36555, partial [Rhizobium johnstonii]